MSTDPVQLLIDAGAIPSNPFGPASRYYNVRVGRYVKRPGDPGVNYVLRRFIPQQRDISIVAQHIVQGGERPELVAAQTLGDPELYWRLADANAVTDPFELNELGQRIAIPTPPGL
jgi:nucleoid-associated protein YgaU